MTDLALQTGVTQLNVVESLEQMTLPAVETITAGAAVRIDTSTGKFTLAKGTEAAEARVYGIAVRGAAAGVPVTAIRRGVVDGLEVSALAYDAPVYLSDTDGKLADAAGTVSVDIGRVIPIPATTIGTAYDKALLIDMPATEVTFDQKFTITSELLAASVDKHLFVADRAYQVTKIQEIHSVVGGSGAVVRPRKILAASASAPGAAAGANVKELTTADIDLTAAIDVAQTPELSATAADLLLATGDKIALNLGGTLTGLVGLIVIELQPV